jgi:hypothetical protein
MVGLTFVLAALAALQAPGIAAQVRMVSIRMNLEG